MSIDTITPLVQREVEEEEVKEEEGILQTKKASGYAPKVSLGIESRINEMKSRGQPLSESVRANFEPQFSCDFSQVRPHIDGQGGALAKTVRYRGFTIGPNIFFG